MQLVHRELCQGEEAFVQQSQVGPGRRWLGSGRGLAHAHTESLPHRTSCNRSDYPLRERKWPLLRCLPGLEWDGMQGELLAVSAPYV